MEEEDCHLLISEVLFGMKFKAQGVPIRQDNIVCLVGIASEVDDNIHLLFGRELLDIFNFAD